MEPLLLQLTGVIALGVGASWLAWRLRLPSILLLLVVGFLAGPVTGLLDPDALLGDLLFPIVSLSVAVILFEGGLSLDVAELKVIGSVLRNLATIGVVVTWVLSALLAHLLLGLDWALSVLFGSILVVTGPTVIVPLLRHVRPSPRVGSAVKWEGIVNDPIGAILAVLVFEAILAGGIEHGGAAALGVLRAVVFGTALGLAAAVALLVPLGRYWIPDFLHNPAALVAALSTFVVANALQAESGLLAVTVMGSTLASQKRVLIQNIVEFKENLRVLLISVLFIVLAGRLPATSLTPSLGGLLFLIGLIVLVRPAAVALSTWGTPLTWKERSFLAVMAPRGIVAAAVSSIFALRLSQQGYPGAERLIPVTFLVIVGTVVVYGLAAAPVARRLGVASPNPQGLLLVGAEPWVRSLAALLHESDIRVLLVDSNWSHAADARQAGLPTYHGNVLSEHLLEELPLDGIGRLLALTSNDEVNALAALHFSEVFGRENVYQIAADDLDSRQQGRTMPGHLRGRTLFDPSVTYLSIAARFDGGARFKRTPITEEFDLESYRAHYGDRVLPLFVLKDSGELTVATSSAGVKPKAGQALISLIGA